MNLAVLEGYLRPLGHQLVRAADGRAALASFDEVTPDLVLLDFVMPGFDGIDVLTHLRARPRGLHVPVVLVTAYGDREHRLRGIEAGADEFLEKPVDSAILTARVRTLLSLKESRDALQESRDELARRHQALEVAQREHRELTEFIVHDLKSPLSVVYGGLGWVLEQRSIAAEVKDALSDAYKAAGRLRSMIGDLLTISRLEQSNFPLQRESVSLAKLVRSVIQSHLRRAEELGIALAPAPDVSLEVSADAMLLRRVLENILDNALRYTPKSGRVAIDVRAAAGVEIAISNDGPAIPLAQRSRIFEKFARGEGQPGEMRNAGLGLYFCKRAVEAHGGAIELRETEEWPTSFLIRLPASMSAGP
jgi:signal transduction histidine kinase